MSVRCSQRWGPDVLEATMAGLIYFGRCVRRSRGFPCWADPHGWSISTLLLADNDAALLTREAISNHAARRVSPIQSMMPLICSIRRQPLRQLLLLLLLLIILSETAKPLNRSRRWLKCWQNVSPVVSVQVSLLCYAASPHAIYSW
jgi:hypothetical protein